MFRIPAHPTAFPFQVIAMDLITQLPKSEGSDAILTIVDQGCTRAAVFIPCSTTISGEGVAQLYLENVYRWFGLPMKVISDRDPRFTSHFARALCEKLQIRQNVSTAFHPQTNGLSERKNQWIEQFLRLITSVQQSNWKRWLPLATAIHNNHVNSTTKVTPARALLGYLPQLDPAAPPITRNENVEERAIQAQQYHKQAQAALDQVAEHTPADQFKVGAQVWLEAKNLALPYQTRKLAPRCHGPFTITKQVSPVAYQLALPPTWTIHDVFHASLLTPYHETREHGVNYNRPPPDMVDGEEEYEVEAIMGHRFFGRGCKLQYLVRWKGYSAADDTWEPEGQVFAPKLKEAYHRKHPRDSPFPHKRGGKSTRKSIRHLFPSLRCRTTLGTSPASRLLPTLPLQLHLQPHSQCRRQRWPSKLTKNWNTPLLHPNAPSPRVRSERCNALSPHEPPSPPSKPSISRISKNLYKGSPRPALRNSLPTPPTMSTPSRRYTTRSCTSDDRKPPYQSCGDPVSAPRASLTTTEGSTSSSPTESTEARPDMSDSPPTTPPKFRRPWGSQTISYTPSPSTPLPATDMTRIPMVHSLSGSEASCTPPTPTTESSCKDAVSSTTGDSPLTSPATAKPRSRSESSRPTGSGSTPRSPGSERPSTLRPLGWGLQTQQDALPPFETLGMSRPQTTTTTENAPAGLGESPEASEPVGGLAPKRRVMTPASLTGKHSYVFCQFVSPALAHENGPCTCFNVGWR